MKRYSLVAVGLLLTVLFKVQTWPGHEWAQWKKITTWQKPVLHTGQEGRADLVPLLTLPGPNRGTIKSVLEWEKQRSSLLEAMGCILGEPTNLKKPKVEVQVLGDEILTDHLRRRLRIRTELEDWIPAYLLLPIKMSGKVPAMICLHQTVSQGKEEPCGIKGNPELAFALELVRKGYVCLAPDVIGFGERIPPGTLPYHDNIKFFQKHPQWSVMGKMNWDLSRLVDFLETLPFVDTHRIGSIGHSHGAYGTHFGIAFETRISAAIASCGFTTFRRDPAPNRWSHLTPLIPQLGCYLPDVASIPFDWHHVCALAAPRPVFVWYATRDSVFPKTDNLDTLFQDVRQVYRLYGADSALAWQAFDGEHRFPEAGRKAAYAWLEKQLAGRGKGKRQGDKETRRQGDKETRRRGDEETRRQGDEETRRQGDKETRRQGDKETRRQGDKETRRQGDEETRRQGDEETRRQGEKRGEAGVSATGVRSKGKTASAFFPANLIARARKNAQVFPWAKQARDGIVAAAQPWVALSDEALWGLMFGNSIKRSWMVWSNGHCPACKKSVPMYEWLPDALNRPWTMQCPRCRELFPKNDFGKFYRSGLNERGVFEPARADRSLLYNVEHPDFTDPLHRFGVDDGDGYVKGSKRWRFVGAYLIYGQWKQAIVGGIRNLAAAYLVTGEAIYAHKAGVLLDRVADLYPTFDFGKEGVLYEGPPSAGYISTWHDACVEVYELTTAYDAVFEGISRDRELMGFLAGKARKHRLANDKSSFADIQRNIEDRLLRDTLAHRPKIESNYPSTDITLAAIRTVLDWPDNRPEINALLDGIIQKATAVDGLSGEKGLFGYSAIAPRTIADLLGRYERMDPGFLAAALKRNPRLHAMYRFHLDTWCLGEYYPCIGDTGSFASKVPHYAGLGLARQPGIGPSAFTFLWDLAGATGDQDFIRLLYAANGHTVPGLPYDLFVENPTAFQQQVERVIAREKADIRLGSINKTQWCLAILRAGTGAQARAAWLDYDSGERHGHADALNLGLFAKGFDLMPDCGYPPVQFGGWGAPRAVWYTQSAAHNTVVVDGQNSHPGRGRCTLWAEGRQFRAVRASAANLVGGKQYERTVALVDLSDRDSYLVDVFRVVGGREHTKFLHSHFGSIQPQGLSLQPAEDTRFGGLMRNFQKDTRPPSSWSVDWKIQDHLHYLPPGKKIHLRCTDLTAAHEVLTAESWVAVGQYGGTAEAWIPRLLVRRQSAQAPLASTFVSVLEPYEGQSGIQEIRRLPLEGAARPEADVALDIRLAHGFRDVVIATDAENPLGQSRPVSLPLIQKETGIRLDGQLALVRFDPAGKVRRLVLCQGQLLEVGSWRLKCKNPVSWVEIDLEKPLAPIVSGAVGEAESLSEGPKKIWPR